ncbi:MAG TPA: hypothetical protein VNU26_09465 [Mycobacteriales bacterium]|nr:hypothetical protein [Mycobacteriales bacterium]
MSRHRHDDEGAALVLALAFFTIIAIGVTALVTLAETGQRATVAVREQGFEIYSADAAVEHFIAELQANPSLGRDVPGSPCPTKDYAYNDEPTQVSCTALEDSGVGGGTGATEKNTPPNAILTLATSEDGVVHESSNDLRVTGPVVSNSTARVNVASATMTVDGPVQAAGACSPNIVSVPAPDCNRAGALTNGDDRNYAPQAGLSTRPVPAPDVTGCTGEGRFVVFEPGWYDSVAELNSIFATCTKSVFWFKPGIYYFDFLDATDATPWSITGAQTRVVGGEPARWTPVSAGGPAPIVPFPEQTPTGTSEGGCRTSEEQGAAEGVQWIFGGRSRLFVRDAKVELCAPANTAQQQIAVYGMTPARDTSATGPGTAALAPTSASRDPDADVIGFVNKDAVLASDGVAAIFTATAGGQGNEATVGATVQNMPTLAPGTTIDYVRLRIRHNALNGNVRSIGATVEPAGGGTSATLTDATGSCSTSTTALCRQPSGTPYEQVIDLGGFPKTAEALAGARISVSARARLQGGTAGVYQVDYLALEVGYTQPTYRALSGCLVVSLDASGCALFENVGSPTSLSLHGTFYAPRAGLRTEITNASVESFRRGVIVRTLRARVTGSSTLQGSPFSLPSIGSGGQTDRSVRIEARQDGEVVLRAVVSFDASTSGQDATVASWHVLR